MKNKDLVFLGAITAFVGIALFLVVTKELKYDELVASKGRKAQARVLAVRPTIKSFNKWGDIPACDFELKDIETSQIFIRVGDCPDNLSATFVTTYLPENVVSEYGTLLAVRQKPIFQRSIVLILGIWFIPLAGGFLLSLFLKIRAARAKKVLRSSN